MAGTALVQRVTLKLPTGFVYDKRQEGWELIEDVDFAEGETLEACNFLGEGERSVIGTTLVEREKALGRRPSQRHAERLLGQAADIPEEWGNLLLFTGTVWRLPGGSLCMPYLFRDGRGQWRLFFHWLDYGYDSHFRSVRLCKKLQLGS